MRPSCTQGCQALDPFVGDIIWGINTVQEFLTFQSLFSNMVLGQLDLDPSQHSRQKELNGRDSSISGDTPPPEGGLWVALIQESFPRGSQGLGLLAWARQCRDPGVLNITWPCHTLGKKGN